MLTKIKYQGPALAWALLIFILCTIKMGSVGNSSIFFAGFDKLVHCGLFFVLVVGIASGCFRQSAQKNITGLQLFLSWFVATVYGGVIELLQAYIFTWRTGDWNDLFADTVGASMALFSVLVIIWSQKQK